MSDAVADLREILKDGPPDDLDSEVQWLTYGEVAEIVAYIDELEKEVSALKQHAIKWDAVKLGEMNLNSGPVIVVDEWRCTTCEHYWPQHTMCVKHEINNPAPGFGCTDWRKRGEQECR